MKHTLNFFHQIGLELNNEGKNVLKWITKPTMDALCKTQSEIPDQLRYQVLKEMFCMNTFMKIADFERFQAYLTEKDKEWEVEKEFVRFSLMSYDEYAKKFSMEVFATEIMDFLQDEKELKEKYLKKYVKGYDVKRIFNAPGVEKNLLDAIMWKVTEQHLAFAALRIEDWIGEDIIAALRKDCIEEKTQREGEL